MLHKYFLDFVFLLSGYSSYLKYNVVYRWSKVGDPWYDSYTYHHAEISITICPKYGITKGSLLWDITPCSPLKVNRRLGVIWSLSLLPALRWFLAWLILRPWRGRSHVNSKRQLTFGGLHGVISQKTELFICTAVRISDPTYGIIDRRSSSMNYINSVVMWGTW
jgi:hypothetical protein